MKRLKRKNAELAVIAKRLEERARKLQETNLRVVRTSWVAGKKGARAGQWGLGPEILSIQARGSKEVWELSGAGSKGRSRSGQTGGMEQAYHVLELAAASC